jgi:hypothetical protein
MTEFDDWLAHAEPGKRFVYFDNGYLPRSRDVHWTPVKGNAVDEQAHRVAVAKAARVDAEAHAAMQAMSRGEVMLTQIRRGFLDYEYRATKRAAKPPRAGG